MRNHEFNNRHFYFNTNRIFEDLSNKKEKKSFCLRVILNTRSKNDM